MHGESIYESISLNTVQGKTFTTIILTEGRMSIIVGMNEWSCNLIGGQL